MLIRNIVLLTRASVIMTIGILFIASPTILASWTNVNSGPLGDTGEGVGVAWGDYDNDGDQDIYLCNTDGGVSKLFRNDGAGVFTSILSPAFGNPGNGLGAAWGDYDNDGDLDIYLTKNGANILARNNGDATFTDVSATPINDPLYSHSGSWGDFDGDGLIDLYLTNYPGPNKLFKNNGGGSFTDATCCGMGDAGFSVGIAWCDFDDDGDLDLYWSNNAGTAGKLFRKEGAGVFSNVTPPALLGLTESQGACWADFDNDGDFDLSVAGAFLSLFRNDGGNVFANVTPILFAGVIGGGQCWSDFDNDGDLDLYVSMPFGVASHLYRNDGGGAFTDIASGPETNLGNGHGVAAADYDKDGDLDLYVANRAPGSADVLLRNDDASGNHWLHVNLVGTVSNRAAIGARAEAFAGTLRQIRQVEGGADFMSQNSLTLEFGFGTTAVVDSLIVRWPSGTQQRMFVLPIDTLINVIESVGIVCGDADGSNIVTISDAVFLINYIFSGGPAPNPLASGDADCSGTVNISDAVYLINYIFSGGAAPCAACP